MRLQHFVFILALFYSHVSSVSVAVGIEQKCGGFLCSEVSIVVAYTSLQTGSYQETLTLLPKVGSTQEGSLLFFTDISADKTQFYVATNNDPAISPNQNMLFIYNIFSQALTSYTIPYQITGQSLSSINVITPNKLALVYGAFVVFSDLAGHLTSPVQLWNQAVYTPVGLSAFDSGSNILYAVSNTSSPSCQYLVSYDLSTGAVKQSACYSVSSGSSYVLNNLFSFSAGIFLAVGVDGNGDIKVGLFNPVSLAWGKIYATPDFFNNNGVFWTQSNSVAFDKASMTWAALMQDIGNLGVLFTVDLSNDNVIYASSTEMTSPQFGGFVLPY